MPRLSQTEATSGSALTHTPGETRGWFYFFCAGRFIGKCFTSADEIDATFRHYRIEGATVTLYSAVTKTKA